jgi:hypothetical protein
MSLFDFDWCSYCVSSLLIVTKYGIQNPGLSAPTVLSGSVSAPRLRAGLLLLLLPLSAAAQSDPTVPIEKVVFFKSGVSYVEHRGTVQGTTTMTLRFRDEQMKDVLKSLVLQDLGGGRVGTINYPSQDPLSRTLEGFQVDLSEPGGLGRLSNQLRGAAVTLATGDTTVGGTIVSADPQDGPNGATQWHLTLYRDGGLQSVALDRVQHLRFEDPALQAEMRKALDAVARARNQDENAVRLRFSGQGTRRVRAGYVVEAPVWKTSYRLLLPDANEGQGQMQGWAIVENQTDADWEAVDLTLVSGRPVSFVQDLYTPTYVDRPVVAPTAGEPLPPKQYREGISSDTATAATQGDGDFDASLDRSRRVETSQSAPKARAAQAESAPQMDPSQGVTATATTAEAGAFFQYTVDDVSLPRRRSAMLPIVTEPLQVERISLYDPDVHPTHPLHGARLTNTTGQHLAAGPMSVFDAGSYAGDARMGDTPPGDTRFVTYALNQDVQVDAGGGRTEETVQTGTIVEGVLTMTRKRVASQTYTIENEGETAASLIIEHPRRSGWTLAAPSDVEERTASVYRLRTTVGAGETGELAVEETKMLTRRHQLLGTDRDQLLSYARTGALPDDVQDALEKAADLQQKVSRTKNQLSQARRDLDRLRSEQSRIRENMKAVEQSSDYYQRLLDKLSSTEDRIESLNERIATLEEERGERSDRLGRYLQDLTID